MGGSAGVGVWGCHGVRSTGVRCFWEVEDEDVEWEAWMCYKLSGV